MGTIVYRPDVLHMCPSFLVWIVAPNSHTWHSRRLHWLPGLVYSTRCDVTSHVHRLHPLFTACFISRSEFFSLKRTDRDRHVDSCNIEPLVSARGTPAPNLVLCGCARPIGNFPSRQQAINMPYRAMQLTEHRHAAIFVCFRLILCYIA